MKGALLWALGAMLASPALATPPPAIDSSVVDTGYFQAIVPVAPGVWVDAEPRFQVQPIGNVTVIEQSDGLVPVDAGGSAGSGRRIVEMVRSLRPQASQGDHHQPVARRQGAGPGRAVASLAARPLDFANFGEPARLVRGEGGAVVAVLVAGSRMVTEAALTEELVGRYEGR